MPWSPGNRFGPYEIQSVLGIGGQGEVYKALDTRLDRLVAIKTLPDASAQDPQFRERFQREARAISQLDHPHICALYDVGEQSGTAFLVMQYLEGESLRQRLTRGPLPLDQALRYAVQIADALDKAHRAGIVHRDLKPDNIFLTAAGAKLLDFGLAKSGAVARGEPSGLTTQSRNLTARGTVLGTLPYMAPEQVEGDETDTRTDVFAFGVVLYEMVTGRRPFEAKGEASLIAAIMQSTPGPMSADGRQVPPPLDHLVSRCLAKDPDERWQAMGDVMRELQWIAHGAGAAGGAGMARSRRFPSSIPTRVTALVAVALAAAVVYLLLTHATPAPGSKTDALPIRVAVAPPENSHFSGVQLAFSPDGTRVAFVGLTGQQRQVWVYSLATGESHVLAGSESAHFPFWSADGRNICYASDRGLTRVSADGGPPQYLKADASSFSSGAWNERGDVLFAGASQPGIFRVGSNGGPPTRLTTPDRSRHETEHLHPRFLPGGKQFLYLARNDKPEDNVVCIRSIDADDTKRVIRTPTHAEFVAPGYMMFVRDGVLLAQHFNLSRRELEGDPFPVAPAVGVNSDNGGAAFSVSATGSLVYHAADAEQGELKWADRQGRVRAAAGPRALFRGVDLSPDGRKVVVKIRGTDLTFTGDVWTIDLERGVSSRLTFGARSQNARWSADGTQVFFDSRRRGAPGIYRRRADGTGTEELVWKTEGALADVSNDGKLLVEEGRSCAVVTLHGQPKAETFIASDLPLQCGRFAADGRYLAYTQVEPAGSQVYVLPFPAGTPRVQVSSESGLAPRWRRDGGELFFLSPTGAMMSVTLVYGPTLRASPPVELFRTGAFTSGPFPDYTVSRDGTRFLMIDPVADPHAENLTIIVHWSEALTR